MASAFQLNFEEFSAELDSLTLLVNFSGPNAAEGARARLTAANAATLLLAAIFEEYVRQQVREAFRTRAAQSKSIKERFPEKIISNVWRRALEALQRYSSDDDDWAFAEMRLTAVIAFCLREDVTADIADMVALNANNMRPAQLKELFNQIGVQAIVNKSCDDADLVEFLGAANSGQAVPELESRVEEFFRRRNAIAHAIGSGKSSGPSDLLRDIEMFRIFSRSLASALDTDAAAVGIATNGM
jgi:hypothetical protein